MQYAHFDPGFKGLSYNKKRGRAFSSPPRSMFELSESARFCITTGQKRAEWAVIQNRVAFLMSHSRYSASSL